MERALTFTSGTDRYLVRLDLEGERFVAHIDDTMLAGTFRRLPPGFYTLFFEDGTVEEVSLVEAGDLLAWHRGQVHTLHRPHPDDDAAPAAAGQLGFDGTITTPMPGKVVKVCVTLGQRVEAGAECVVLEAMKMEHVLTTPKAGTIRALHVVPGQQTEFGQVLVEISCEA